MPDQKAPPQKRPRGRPVLRTQGETRALLIAAARTVFLTEGYSGASIDAVAQLAAMSTRTIYKTVSNKADLFRIVVEDAIETSIAQINGPFDMSTSESAVFALTRAYGLLVLGNDGVLTARAVLAEQAQFPELRESYLSSIQQVADAFDHRFAVLCSDIPGANKPSFHDDAAMLRSLINGAQRAAILNPDYIGTATSISDWSDKCTRFAMTAMRSRKD